MGPKGEEQNQTPRPAGTKPAPGLSTGVPALQPALGVFAGVRQKGRAAPFTLGASQMLGFGQRTLEKLCLPRSPPRASVLQGEGSEKCCPAEYLQQ